MAITINVEHERDRCGTCQWFHGRRNLFYNEVVAGECRRGPPYVSAVYVVSKGLGKLKLDEIVEEARAPLVSSKYWCGEHTPWENDNNETSGSFTHSK